MSATGALLVGAATLLLAVAGCGHPSAVQIAPPPPSTEAAPSSSAPPASLSPSTSPSTADCPVPQSGFDCDLQRRLAAVEHYVATRPGTVGIVVRDRRTGAVWRNSAADTPLWTASTIKLAMAVDLFQRDHAGIIQLTGMDRALIAAMLHSSDDDAANMLWAKYSGDNHMAFNNEFPRYGLTSLRPEHSPDASYPYWGYEKCTPNDLDRLINYVLTRLPPSTRDYIVSQLRSVDADQQWGVWGAGASAEPGNKDGWSQEDTGWVMNSVGFVGPDQRYTLAIMNSLDGRGGYDDGRTTVTHVAQLLFSGRTL